MPLKVTWKKGMRLSTEVFDALDLYNDENIRLSNLIATGGRFGLISSHKPFELSVNVSNNILEVVSLSCHGMTKSGQIVDIDFDSNYTNTFDTRVTIPAANDDDAFLLVVKFFSKQWREVNEMYSEPIYVFELLAENSPIDDNTLPIGLLINQYGWRLDETDFVPPCLYTNAHIKYTEQVNRAKLILKSISEKCLSADNCVARHLLASLGMSVTSNYVDIDKNQEGLSPSELFASLQKVIASFALGCTIDEYVSLENPQPFLEYQQRPYDCKKLYRDVQNGLDLCSEISIKMDAVCTMTEVHETPAPPVEKPKSKPQPTSEPQIKGRNRWEGIEI